MKLIFLQFIFLVSIIFTSFIFTQNTFGQAEAFLNIFPQRNQVGTEWVIDLTGAVNSNINPLPTHSLSQTYTKSGEFQDQTVEVLLMQFKSPEEAKLHFDHRINSIIEQGGYKEFSVDSIPVPCYGVFLHQNENGEGSGVICTNANIVFVTLVNSPYAISVDTTTTALQFTKFTSQNLGIVPNPQNNPQYQNGGGCLIATATYGTELAPQIQQLRELRDTVLLDTHSGTAFVSIFNQFYYSFSPQIADFERENPLFREGVKFAIIPMISSLSVLNYVDMNSEAEVLGYGISLILLNIGMYFIVPAIVIVQIKKRSVFSKLFYGNKL